MISTQQRTPLSRRLVFVVAMVALVLIATEVFAWAALSVRAGGIFSWTSFQQLRDGILRPDRGAVPSAGFVVHPYMGYVIRPGAIVQDEPLGKTRRVPVSKWGFPYTLESPVQKRGAGRALIGIVGGSVAANFFDIGREPFARALREAGVLADRDLVFINLAMGGYKQPQQLLIVAYLLTLGAEFDLVINIDGFNEVALHEAENAPKGVFPAFPRGWYGFAGALRNPASRILIAKAAYAGEQRRELAARFSGVPWRYSPTANLVWEFLDGNRARAQLRIQEEFRMQPEQTNEYAATGPPGQFASDRELYGFLVDVWKRSSIQLDRICQANGIHYYHALQPNQYVKGSKPLSDSERKLAYLQDHPYRPGVEKGYGPLRSAGQDLLESGVRFLDLTQLFAGRRETLYVDSCCHFNATGHEIMARHLASAIAEDLGS